MQTTVTIPAEYVEDFRAALVSEIRWEAQCILKDADRAAPDAATILKRLDEPDPEAVEAYADVRGDARLMSHDVALFDQLAEAVICDGSVELDVEGPEALDAVPHVFEAMASKVVGPRLEAALGVGPMDRDWLPKIREQIERVSWAVERAAEWHAKAREALDPQITR